MKFTEIPIKMDAIHDTLVQIPIDEFEGFIEDLKDFIYSLDDSYYFAKAPVNEIIDIYKNIERFISTTITVLTSILDEKDANERAQGYGHSWEDCICILRSLHNNVIKNTYPDIIVMVKRTLDVETIDSLIYRCLKSVTCKLSELISRLQPDDRVDYSDTTQDSIWMESEYLISSLKDMEPVCDQHRSVKIIKMPDDIYNSPKWFFDTSFYHEHVEHHEDHDLAKKIIQIRCPVCGNLIIDRTRQKNIEMTSMQAYFCTCGDIWGIDIVCDNCGTEMMYGISEQEYGIVSRHGPYVPNYIERRLKDFISYPVKFYPENNLEDDKKAKPKKRTSYDKLDSIKLFFVMLVMFLFAAPVIDIIGYEDDLRADRYVNTVLLWIGIALIPPIILNGIGTVLNMLLFAIGGALIFVAVLCAIIEISIEWSEIKTVLRKEE